MPEGPSLLIAKEELSKFIGKKIVAVAGNSKIDKDRMKNKKLQDIKTWGKHLLLCFSGFTIRIHFLMFGKYLVNETRDKMPSLHLKFSKEEINFYTSAVMMIEEPLDEVYDWSADVLNDHFDPRAAVRKLKKHPEKNVADALLDQEIFSGVGNIIKNEVLYRIGVHPYSIIGSLPPKKLNELVRQARVYSFDFLKWKKKFELKKHWLAHTKKLCVNCGGVINKEYIGTTARRTFFCNTCQNIYS